MISRNHKEHLWFVRVIVPGMLTDIRPVNRSD